MKKLSKISAMHYGKLIFRSLIFIISIFFYIFDYNWNSWICLVCMIFAVEIVLRFFPSSFESMGCQKQFSKTYIKPQKPGILVKEHKIAFIIALVWIAFNWIFIALYWIKVLDARFLFLISMFYSVCDMICILFFCPFQSWFMKNKCCGTCRIYNWDFAMMFTPLIFVNNIYTRIVVILSFALLIVWEILAFSRPERFCENTNEALACKNCKEKLCKHKRHILKFRIKKWKAN